jgi:hypothetical protein
MEEYVNKVPNLKNKLLLREIISNKSICQLVLNAFEKTMKTLLKL